MSEPCYALEDAQYLGYKRAKEDCIEIIRKEIACCQDLYLRKKIIKEIKKLKCF